MAGDVAAKAMAKGAEYRRVIDRVSLFAAMGLVLDHTLAVGFNGYPSWGPFLILTSYFSVGSYLRSGGANFWSSRAMRSIWKPTPRTR